MTPFFQNFPQETTQLKKTFAGVLSDYWDEIAEVNGWGESTQKSYTTQYQNILLPKTLLYLSLDEYEEVDCENIIDDITHNKQYSESTIRHYRHLINVVVEAGVRHNLCSDILSGTAFELPEGDFLSARNRRLVTVRKSLTIEQSIFIAKTLLSDPKTISGEDLGLLLMYLSGERNNEAVAVTYGDFKQLPEHPDVWCLYISKSTKEKSVALKASGKTPNSPRILPLPSVLSRFLQDRKAYIAELYASGKIDMKGVDPEYGVDGLRIVCHGNRYNSSCQADDLGRQAKKLFATVPDFDPDSLRMLDLERLQSESEGGIVERDPTAYLFRHNLATMLFNLGLESQEVQYYIGHDIENTEMLRNDFVNPEILYHIWEKIEQNPLNYLPLYPEPCDEDSEESIPSETKVVRLWTGSKGASWIVEIKPLEPNQEAVITVSRPEYVFYVSGAQDDTALPTTADITAQMKARYIVKYSEMYSTDKE